MAGLLTLTPVSLEIETSANTSFSCSGKASIFESRSLGSSGMSIVITSDSVGWWPISIGTKITASEIIMVAPIKRCFKGCSIIFEKLVIEKVLLAL